MNEFYEYVLSFYGPGGLYDMGATRAQVRAATNKVIDKHGTGFCGDSIDRERVRDKMIAMFGLKFPTPAEIEKNAKAMEAKSEIPF